MRFIFFIAKCKIFTKKPFFARILLEIVAVLWHIVKVESLLAIYLVNIDKYISIFDKFLS